MYSMPASAQSAASSSLIGREASEMSVSPAQKRSKPPPVPEIPTVRTTPEFSAPNSSAAAVVSGPTVLEPSASTEPESSSAGASVSAGASAGAVAVASPPLSSSELPQPVAIAATETATSASRSSRRTWRSAIPLLSIRIDPSLPTAGASVGSDPVKVV